MKEWKIKQEIFHRLNVNHDDDLSLHNVEINDDVVGCAIKYFLENSQGWVYPSKSYVVAICYARWISEEYNEDFYQLLNDEELLYKNDPYFKTYAEDPDTYDKIITAVGLKFNEDSGIIPDVKKYYRMEFSYE
jgi:hypothetical protein